MDIRDKLLQTVDANDPQFRTLLHNAIQAEIKHLEETLAAKRALNERKRLELKHLLERRKELKKSIKQKVEMIPILEKASECLRDYSNKLLTEMTLVKNMADPESLSQLTYIEEEKKLLKKLEKKCNEYEAEFEKDPLAQELKKIKQGLLKIRVEILMREQNIKNMEESYKIYEDIQKKREKQQIIAIAEIYVRYRKRLRGLEALKEERAKLNAILAQQEQQIQSLMAEQKDMDKQNLLARIQMPPPIMDRKFVETMFPSSMILTTEINNPDSHNDDLSDSASICSLVLEEMCNVTGNMNISTTEAEQMEIEPDVVSLATIDDSQCTDDVGSERSLQSPARFSRASHEPSAKKVKETINLKKGESTSKIGRSPRAHSTSQRNRNDVSVPKNVPRSELNVEEYSANLGAIKKIPRVHPTGKRSRNEVSIPKNVPGNQKDIKQYSADLRAVKRGKTTTQNEQPAENLYSTYSEAPEILDISEDSVTVDNDVFSETHSVSESVHSYCSNISNIQQKDAEPEFLSDVSFQSCGDDNNSIVCTLDGMSNANNDNALAGQNSPHQEPPAATPFGMFSQKKTFPFQGSLFK